ncbi:MAG: Re/Si-specific NAD(P)(+) transhydrogenase subunit alpha [Gemmatimonadetes bacterium]|nr:Re/Si-specific NAD(P)(+) transhydrogenase subunit alpha [Gemmatimonadota bacterium]
MQVGVVKETQPGERRVALVPESVRRLAGTGVSVLVESGAGDEAGFTNAMYEKAGARIATSAQDVLQSADILVKVRAPTHDGSGAEVAALRRGSTVIGLLQPLTSPGLIRELASRGVTAIAMELIPRITKAQSMDVLSSQATVAGYKAVLIAAAASPRMFPMLMTAAGTIPPSKVLVLGAGVAGLQAIATARRLGAVVEGYDVRPEVKEQVESLGARWVGLAMEEAVGAGGYAKEVSKQSQALALEHLHKLVVAADVVITTAQIPGRKAPLLITEDMVHAMQPGAVIVDLAAESGGNCALTLAGEEVVANGVRIIGPPDLSATLPLHASQMYSRNLLTLLQHLLRDGALVLDLEDEITKGCLVTKEGEIVHERTREALAAT